MQKWYELWFQKMLFISEHTAVYCYQSKSYLQILKQPSTILAMMSQLYHSIL